LAESGHPPVVGLTRQFAPKWNRLPNGCKLEIDSGTAQNLRAANLRMNWVVDMVADTLDHLDYCWQIEKGYRLRR